MSPKEDYQPSPEETARAEAAMLASEKRDSGNREALSKKVDFELLKKCDLTVSVGQSYALIHGTVDGRKLWIKNYDNGSAFEGDDSLDSVTGDSGADLEKLWKKYFPIAVLLDYDKEH